VAFSFFKKKQDSSESTAQNLVEGTDYYLEEGKYVFTSHYHLKRGYCCGSGCRHCPYPKEEDAKASRKGN